MATILVLGGYGNTGKLLTKHLLTQTNVEIIISGRDLEKARSFANTMNTPRISVRYANAASLDAHVDYLDIQLSSKKLQVLYALEKQIKQAGLCFMTEAGYHPGLPAAMIRYAALKMDTTESALAAGYLKGFI